MIKFYIALYTAKIVRTMLKILGRKATFFPGRVAITICKDFLGKIDKPKQIIGVTGTNGKTTVCNLIIDALNKNNYKVLDNRLGSNIDAGIAAAFISGVNIRNKTKYEIAVLEIDERSSPKVFPYVKPTYLVCTNLFRDSIRRNAHPEFILNIINKNLPVETKLILNADDLISSSLGTTNEKTYFAIDKLDTDKTESDNIINDVRICPKCHAKLKYNYVRYHHIGNAYCPNCGFKSPKPDYEVTKIDFEKNKIAVKRNGNEGENKNFAQKGASLMGEKEYKLISNSIFNIYNEAAVIALLCELGMEEENIQKVFDEENIVGSRYKEEKVNGIKIVSHMAKGQNPIACSCVFDYIRSEKGKKEIILLLFDLFDAKESSENITWLYDCDFEFLNSNDIDKIIIGGPRAQDFYLRLLIAGVPKEKLVFTEEPKDTANYLSLDKEKDIYILFELYDEQIANDVREEVKNRIQNSTKDKTEEQQISGGAN